MTLATRILDLKYAIVGGLSSLMEFIASKAFDYPNNLGMPITSFSDDERAIWDYVSQLPKHLTIMPPPAAPVNFNQAIFGNFPVMLTIKRTFFEHSKDGFYNFYVPNYNNIFFLPDWVSQLIQVNFDVHIDTTPLEIIRQGLFLGIVSFMFLMEFRMKMYWFLTINPYTRPWVYFISLTDWLYDVVSGFTPVFLGLDLTPTVLLGVLGKMADSLNHLVFTMPFLPSEGEPGKMLIDGEMKDVILFRYLPYLWYSHPIPDKLREFWYTERPEIYEFMKKSYGHLDIEFLPNRILKEMYEQQQDHKVLVSNIDNLKNLSTNLICEISTHSPTYFHVFNDKQINLNDFFDVVTDKFIT